MGCEDDDGEFYDCGYYDDDDDDSDGAEEEDDDVDEEEAQLSEEEDIAPPERRPEFWAIKKESLAAAQQEDLSMVMGLFNIKQHHARALLIHYRWNTDRINDHLERKGQERMLMEAGVVLQDQLDSKPPPPSSSSRSSRTAPVTCMVCFEDHPPRAVSTMDCGHSFCNGCWTGHFVAALDGGRKQARCMAVRCPAICDEAVVQRLLARRDPAAAERFRDFLLRSYVDDNGAARWCPSAPHCGRAIVRAAAAAEADADAEVECPCGACFCFRCAASAHSPCPCAMWERWEAKGRGEAENVKWILAHTKSCPKCHRPIVKDGGCNLVTCKCGQPMCWLCGGATGSAHTWTTIAGHSCNRFDDDDAAAGEEARKADRARRQLRRYEHYYQRFRAHAVSRGKELGALGPAVAARVAALEWRDGALVKDAAWLAGAHAALLRCRHVLSHSYVFAYYMFDGEAALRPTEPGADGGGLSVAQRQDLFEHYQCQLEGTVEQLSRLLAEDVAAMPDDEVLKARQHVVNHVATVEAHCGKMYGCIQDELLPMLVEPMSIVAYQTRGPTKATDLDP